MIITTQDLACRFSYHAATADRALVHEDVRGACLDLAKVLVTTLPESREASWALMNLEQVMFWGNAAIARQHAEGNAPLDVM